MIKILGRNNIRHETFILAPGLGESDLSWQRKHLRLWWPEFAETAHHTMSGQKAHLGCHQRRVPPSDAIPAVRPGTWVSFLEPAQLPGTTAATKDQHPNTGVMIAHMQTVTLGHRGCVLDMFKKIALGSLWLG